MTRTSFTETSSQRTYSLTSQVSFDLYTGYLCLTDFGLAKMISDENFAQSFCGTPEYLAPEIITGEGHNKPVDWWSVGILIYEMIVGIPPFYHRNQNTMYEIITKFPVRFPDPVKHSHIKLSEEAQDIITKVGH